MSETKLETGQVCRICSTPTTNKCTSCKLASYCNREHQKEDWKNHKDECRPFQVKSTLELGRFLEATRRINADDVLFSELPIVFGPRSEDPVCLGCYDPSPRERCLKCFWPACSSACPGLTDPDHHGSECTVLQLYARKVEFIAESFFRCDIILPLRCLLLQRKNPKSWKTIMEMEAHMKKRGPNTEIYKQVQTLVNHLEENFFNILTKVEKESKTETKILAERSPEIIHKICGILDVNAVEIQLPKGGSLNALYPTTYLLEHNCLPNTRHVFKFQPFKKFKITVYANQDINQGNHISTMYTHALWGTQQRQDHLRSTKYFTCRCKRCGDPSELGTNLSALICLAHTSENKICGGIQLPVAPLDITTEWKCDKCPTSLTSGQVFELVNMISGQLDHLQEEKPTVDGLENLLRKLRKLFHQNHYHCYSVMHSLIQLYGRQDGYLPHQMKEDIILKKIEMCKQLLNITLSIDPTSSRLALYSSIIKQELATSLLLLAKRKKWSKNEMIENLRESRTHLIEAKKSLELEEEDSPGAKVSKVISNNIEELDAFCRVSDINL